MGLIQYGQNDRISNTELWSLIFVFIMGSMLSTPVGYNAGHDSWISGLVGAVVGVGINWIYASLCAKFPHKSLVEIAQLLLGSWIGKLIGLLYAWYSFYLGAYVLRNFMDMTGAMLLPRTPTVIVSCVMIALVTWGAFKGIEVLCRCALILFPLVGVSMVLIGILSIPDMDPTNIFPIFESGWTSMLAGAGQVATVPLGETIMFAMLIPYVNRPAAAPRTIVTVIGFVGLFIVIEDLISIFVLGEIITKQLFPVYTSLMYISVGDFIERIEPIIFTIWIFNEFTKLSVCLLTAGLALSQTTGSRDYRFYLIPLGLMIVVFSLFVHRSQLDLIAFIKEIGPVYTVPFLVIVPLVLLLVSLARGKTLSRRLAE